MKTTFLEKFQQSTKFFSEAYGRHKSTFNGLSDLLSKYCSLQRTYSSELMYLSKSTVSCLKDFKSELPFIQDSVRDIADRLQRESQLHFTFAERIKQIGDCCKAEYEKSKHFKDRTMRFLRDKSKEDLENARNSRRRELVNETERIICRALYDALDGYLIQENTRAHKVKEQITILSAQTKKIQEKQLELGTAYYNRLSSDNFVLDLPQVRTIEATLIEQHNGYESNEKLQVKVRDFIKPIQPQRDSLRESVIHRAKQKELQEKQSQIHSIAEKYKAKPSQLLKNSISTKKGGLFDPYIFKNHPKYARQVKSECLKELCYQMLEGYCEQGEEALSLFRVRLKVKSNQRKQAKTLSVFISQQPRQQALQWHLGLMLIVSCIEAQKLQISTLETYIRDRTWPQGHSAEQTLSKQVSLVVIDYLLQPTVLIRDGHPLLQEDYMDIVKLVSNFTQQFLKLEPVLVILVLLRKVERGLTVKPSDHDQKIELILSAGIDVNRNNVSESIEDLGAQVLNSVTNRLLFFYKNRTSLNNAIKILFVLQNILPDWQLSTIEHLGGCLMSAGYTFLIEYDENGQLLDPGMWRGQQQLKHLVEVMEESEYDSIYKTYMEPTVFQMPDLLGINKDAYFSYLKAQFSSALHDIVACNLAIINAKEGIDRDGYALRLGICLAIADRKNKRQIRTYDNYFKVLQTYLSATEQQYYKLLQHSRQTELWIIQQNSQATQSCIDFCSILYKPFEFLLHSLRKLGQHKGDSSFAIKFSQFIKLRLNTILKNQLIRYVQFLLESLQVFNYEPVQLTLKSKRGIELSILATEDISRDKRSFREATRRISNLLFLKDVLEEIMKDFLEPAIYHRLDNSIFNLKLLEKVACNDQSGNKEILMNILEIVALISSIEPRIVQRVADVAVYFLMDRLFTNLYRQNQMNAIQTFFSSKSDYKLSEFTFVKSEKQLEELMSLIVKTVPDSCHNTFSIRFTSCFFNATQNEILNSSKFRFPFKAKEVQQYLDADITFVATMFKQRFIDPQIVKQQLEDPISKLLRDLQTPTLKLISSFEDHNIKNDTSRSRYYLLLLNLRLDDEQATEFVRKFKSLAFK